MTAPFKLRIACVAPPFSGTGYTARLLTSLGIVCGHEHLFQQHKAREDFSGPGPWGHAWADVQAESSWPIYRHEGHPYLATVDQYVHIVRNPLHVVESLWRKRGGDHSLTGLTNILNLYREITEWIEGRELPGYCRYRIEEGPEALAKLVGAEMHENIFTDRGYNTHMHGAKRFFTSWDVVEDMVEADLMWHRANAEEKGY